jgi:hypothetical protein
VRTGRVGDRAAGSPKAEARVPNVANPRERSRQGSCQACEPGVPLIDRGVLQGVLVVQTIEARVFRDHEVRMLVEAAVQVGRVVSEARTLDRFIAPVQERLWSLARNLWWSWDHDTTNLFRDLDPIRWRQLNHNPVSLLGEMPLAMLERRARELALHSRINYAYRRQQEYLRADRTWGAMHAGVLRPRPVAYFSAEFGLHESLPVYSRGPRRSGGRSHQERLRPGHPTHRHRIVLRARVFPAAVGSEQHGADRNSRRGHPRQGLARKSWAPRSASARFRREGERSRRPRVDIALIRRRREGPHSPGTAPGEPI